MNRIRRGQLYTIDKPRSKRLLVVSGNLTNDLPDQPFVLAMTIWDREPEPPFFVALPNGTCVEVMSMRQYPKRFLHQTVDSVSTQVLTNIDNALFKILATN